MDAENKRIGQRIRALRLSRSMTQKQLAGDSITRNMLSLIENGSASPSLATLTELAHRLGVPVGYFFASNDEEISHFLKMGMIEELRKLYGAGKYTECLSLCATLSRPDEEIQLLIAECNLALADKAFQNYALASASACLEKVSRAAARCLYLSDRIAGTTEYLSLLIRSVSLTEIPEKLGEPASFAKSYIPAEFMIYVRALRLAESGDTAGAEDICQSGLISSPVYLDFLHARLLIAEGRTEEAEPLLRRQLTAAFLGFFTKLHLLNAMELCASAAGDFKSAYQFSTQKVRLLEQFAK